MSCFTRQEFRETYTYKDTHTHTHTHTHIHKMSGAISFDQAGFGRGTGPIVLDNLACSVAETRLIECTSNQGSFNCGHGSDAGVICLPAYTPGPGERLIRIV